MEIYNNQMMNSKIDVLKLSAREKFGFSAGILDIYGMNKEEYNSMILKIRSNIENPQPLLAGIFPTVASSNK